MTRPITETPQKIYLSDGAYVDWDENMQAVKLTAENGVDALEAIYLDPHAMHLLLRWWHHLSDKA